MQSSTGLHKVVSTASTPTHSYSLRSRPLATTRASQMNHPFETCETSRDVSCDTTVTAPHVFGARLTESIPEAHAGFCSHHLHRSNSYKKSTLLAAPTNHVFGARLTESISEAHAGFCSHHLHRSNSYKKSTLSAAPTNQHNFGAHQVRSTHECEINFQKTASKQHSRSSCIISQNAQLSAAPTQNNFGARQFENKHHFPSVISASINNENAEAKNSSSHVFPSQNNNFSKLSATPTNSNFAIHEILCTAANDFERC